MVFKLMFYFIIIIQVIKQCDLVNLIEIFNGGIFDQSASVRSVHKNVEALSVK